MANLKNAKFNTPSKKNKKKNTQSKWKIIKKI